jgi:hypothetical protein
MTDKEKIEKLLQHLENIGDAYECDSHFANEERWDNRYDDDWCGQHFEWNCPHKECFRHFLLGE